MGIENEKKTETITFRAKPSVKKKIQKEKINVSTLIEVSMFENKPNKYEIALRKNLKAMREKKKRKKK